ncbi:MAG TPA: outer membrane beta-barrel protein [Allosphingosinicella sp.]|nr:outer membrane beta-barrel protein [Allosphingosinicella sp.]
MRKYLLAAAAAAALSAPALARDGAPYVGAEFGAMKVQDIDFDIGTTRNSIEIDHEYGYDGAIFAGYDLGAFRVEIEASQKRATIDGFSSANRLFGNNFGTVIQNQRDFDDGFGRTKVRSLMLNGMLDFGDDEGVSAFVGGGVGYGQAKIGIGAFENAPRIIDDEDSGFAWQLMAGVRQALTRNIDVHLKYRFFNMDVDIDRNQEVGLFEAVGGTEGEGRIRTHSLLGGLTFNFGAPPPVIVAPPPPVFVPPPPVDVPPPPPAMQTCPNGTVIPVTAICPPPPQPLPRRGERG